MKHLTIFFFLITSFLFAKNPTPLKINWISFEKAIELNKTNPKPILVDIYTDWCHWCKVMDEKTYEKEEIANYINNNFYAVKLNAEQKETITFNNKEFKFVPSGRRGYHELANALLNGKMSYPSTVFLNKKQELVQAIPGYIKTPMMEKLINFMGQEVYLNKGWEAFEKEFKSKL